MPDEPRIYFRHMRRAKLCAQGGRAWAARNGFSWSDFIANGIPVSAVAHLNDAFLARVLAEVEKERAGE
jgi:hypothetical protein